MIYISNLNKLPTNCRDCKLRGFIYWTCRLVKWNHSLPITNQNIDIIEKDWYDRKWKHPDCPLKEL